MPGRRFRESLPDAVGMFADDSAAASGSQVGDRKATIERAAATETLIAGAPLPGASDKRVEGIVPTRNGIRRISDASAANDRDAGGIIQVLKKNRKYAWPASIAILLVAVPLYYGYVARYTINCDPFIFGQNAKDMLEGKRLYADILENKPVLALVFYLIPQLLFPRSYEAIVAFCGIILVIQAALCLWVLRANRALAFASAVFLTLFPVCNPDYVWPSTEHFSNLFTVANVLLAYAIVRKRDFTLWQCFAIGLLTGLAFQVRQTALITGVVPFAAVATAAASWRRKLAGVAAMFAGGAVALAIAVGLVVKFSDLQSYINTIFFHSHSYAAVGWDWAPIVLTNRILGSGLGVFFVLFFVMAMTGRYRWLALVAGVAAMVQCLCPFRVFDHYGVGLFPYVIFLSALALGRSNRGSMPLASIWCAVLLIVVLPQAGWLLKYSGEHANWYTYQGVAAAVEDVATPGATLLVFAPSTTAEPIQLASTLPPAHMIWPVWNLDPPACELIPRSGAEIMEKPPTVLVARLDYAQFVVSAKDPTRLTRSQRLLRSLMNKYQYDPKGNVAGYSINVLVGQKR